MKSSSNVTVAILKEKKRAISLLRCVMKVYMGLRATAFRLSHE